MTETRALLQKILIVDDDPTLRNVMECWFTRRGFCASVAADGAEAVEKCRGESYGVVTMDLDMPRMNGEQAIQIIKHENPGTPIIVVTGYAQNAARLREQSVEAVLIKPLCMAALENEVRRVFDNIPEPFPATRPAFETCETLP